MVGRCVHPDDDPATINPLDAENRWSYVFLGQRQMRNVATALFEGATCAVFGGPWMCANERPYLDNPGQLEFPTETWPAQDLRKAAVFEFAARYTRDEGDRASFLARADDFVDYATATLAGMPTSRLARPVVLLLAFGMLRPRLARPMVAAAVPLKAIERSRFTPLRRRLVRKLMWAGAGLSAAAIVATCC